MQSFIKQKCCQPSNFPNPSLQDTPHASVYGQVPGWRRARYHILTCLILSGLRSPLLLWFLLGQSPKSRWLIYVQKSTRSAIPTFNAIVIITYQGKLKSYLPTLQVIQAQILQWQQQKWKTIIWSFNQTVIMYSKSCYMSHHVT